MQNFFGKSVIVRFANFCRKAQLLEQPLLGHLRDIFSSNLCDICSCKGTDFKNKFHSLRLSKCVQCVYFFLSLKWMWEEDIRHNLLPAKVSP